MLREPEIFTPRVGIRRCDTCTIFWESVPGHRRHRWHWRDRQRAFDQGWSRGDRIRQRRGKGAALADRLGEHCRFIACDVGDPAQVEQAFATIRSVYGKLDCAFNNAGVTARYGALADSCPEDWMKVMNINVNGTYHCMRHELQLMLTRGIGAIVNTSSCAGVVPIGGQVAYVASKQAINGMTQVASIENARLEEGGCIRVNAVAPGPILAG